MRMNFFNWLKWLLRDKQVLRLPKSSNCEPHMGGIADCSGRQSAWVSMCISSARTDSHEVIARFLFAEGTHSFLPSFPCWREEEGLIVDFISRDGGWSSIFRSRAILKEETEGCQFANEKQKQHICCGFGQRASMAASKSKLQPFIRTIKRPHLLLGQKVRGEGRKKIIIIWLFRNLLGWKFDCSEANGRGASVGGVDEWKCRT